MTKCIARGYTHVQINIPPQRTKVEDLFVVTCEYDPQEHRSHWPKKLDQHDVEILSVVIYVKD